MRTLNLATMASLGIVGTAAPLSARSGPSAGGTPRIASDTANGGSRKVYRSSKSRRSLQRGHSAPRLSPQAGAGGRSARRVASSRRETGTDREFADFVREVDRLDRTVAESNAAASAALTRAMASTASTRVRKAATDPKRKASAAQATVHSAVQTSDAQQKELKRAQSAELAASIAAAKERQERARLESELAAYRSTLEAHGLSVASASTASQATGAQAAGTAGDPAAATAISSGLGSSKRAVAAVRTAGDLANPDGVARVAAARVAHEAKSQHLGASYAAPTHASVQMKIAVAADSAAAAAPNHREAVAARKQAQPQALALESKRRPREQEEAAARLARGRSTAPSPRPPPPPTPRPPAVSVLKLDLSATVDAEAQKVPTVGREGAWTRQALGLSNGLPPRASTRRSTKATPRGGTPRPAATPRVAGKTRRNAGRIERPRTPHSGSLTARDSATRERGTGSSARTDSDSPTSARSSTSRPHTARGDEGDSERRRVRGGFDSTKHAASSRGSKPRVKNHSAMKRLKKLLATKREPYGGSSTGAKRSGLTRSRSHGSRSSRHSRRSAGSDSMSMASSSMLSTARSSELTDATSTFTDVVRKFNATVGENHKFPEYPSTPRRKRRPIRDLNDVGGWVAPKEGITTLGLPHRGEPRVPRKAHSKLEVPTFGRDGPNREHEKRIYYL